MPQLDNLVMSLVYGYLSAVIEENINSSNSMPPSFLP